MIGKIISWSIRNRWVVIIFAVFIAIAGFVAVEETPVDAIPDLSENQVIVYSEWMGRSPQIMEDQVTYPLLTHLQGLPQVKAVRGSSMFGMSFIFIIFKDNADIYWARSRVLERLNYAQRFLPQGVAPTIGPDGTGVGHIFWYTLEGKGYNAGELRTLQDWYVRFGLQHVEGVSEIASFGGYQKQYQVVIDPHRLIYHNISLMDVVKALKANNSDAGGRVLEMNGSACIIRGLGYMRSKNDIEAVAVKTEDNVALTIGDVATVQTTGDLRLGIIDENGNGERAGGIVVMRYGENPQKVIERIKNKMQDLQKGLPPGVTFKSAYDRSGLISSALNTLKKTLIEEIIIVSLVILLFLFHVRSALVVIIMLPVSILISFLLMYAFGVTSNIMSLSGIAIAIGVIVDAGIVMVENAYRHLTEN